MMPIRPDQRARYPKDWKAISLKVRNEAGWRCEQCGACHGVAHPDTGSTVVLTVAHLDHQPENCDRANLRAWCQRCHNRHDAPTRAAGRKARRVVERGTLPQSGLPF
jgi:5-methylcytosine-specific restriction endonuclease McrA